VVISHSGDDDDANDDDQEVVALCPVQKAMVLRRRDGILYLRADRGAGSDVLEVYCEQSGGRTEMR
jgi:hypothetical protein